MKLLSDYEEVICMRALDSERNRLIKDIKCLKKCCGDCEKNEDSDSKLYCAKHELLEVEKLIKKLRG